MSDVILVTGASSGIDAAIAARLAENTESKAPGPDVVAAAVAKIVASANPTHTRGGPLGHPL